MLFDSLNQRLIVSCQPVPGGPMDNAGTVVGLALAAIAGGASALRIESLPYLRAVRGRTGVPLVGIIKRDLPDSPVRITPHLEDAAALAGAGADIVAFDATARPRPASVADLIATIHRHGKLAMADCASLDDARRALAAGADCAGTTLSGYVDGPEPAGPDFPLIAAIRELTPHVIAEGRVRVPEQAAEAMRRGAMSVVVGSAVTRVEHVTSWFRAALDGVVAERTRTVLAIDIGGSKILAALVRGGQVAEEIVLPTEAARGPDAWIETVVRATGAWRGRFDVVGAAVTGLVHNGEWSALNPATLDLPDRFPLLARLHGAFGVPALATNDAQAAAWAEYRSGAGGGEDMVFLTISTGIGGGVVLDGRLLGGLAGHFGLWRGRAADHPQPLENEVSGHWIAAEASRAGQAGSAADVFAAAATGAVWAQDIVAASASRVAGLCLDIQLAFDPRRIVIGGGIGLAHGYLDRVRSQLALAPPRLRPAVTAARHGRLAGVIGVAGLAASAPSLPASAP